MTSKMQSIPINKLHYSAQCRSPVRFEDIERLRRLQVKRSICNQDLKFFCDYSYSIPNALRRSVAKKVVGKQACRLETYDNNNNLLGHHVFARNLRRLRVSRYSYPDPRMRKPFTIALGNLKALQNLAIADTTVEAVRNIRKLKNLQNLIITFPFSQIIKFPDLLSSFKSLRSIFITLELSKEDFISISEEEQKRFLSFFDQLSQLHRLQNLALHIYLPLQESQLSDFISSIFPKVEMLPLKNLSIGIQHLTESIFESKSFQKLLATMDFLSLNSKYLCFLESFKSQNKRTFSFSLREKWPTKFVCSKNWSSLQTIEINTRLLDRVSIENPKQLKKFIIWCSVTQQENRFLDSLPSLLEDVEMLDLFQIELIQIYAQVLESMKRITSLSCFGKIKILKLGVQKASAPSVLRSFLNLLGSLTSLEELDLNLVVKVPGDALKFIENLQSLKKLTIHLWYEIQNMNLPIENLHQLTYLSLSIENGLNKKDAKSLLRALNTNNSIKNVVFALIERIKGQEIRREIMTASNEEEIKKREQQIASILKIFIQSPIDSDLLKEEVIEPIILRRSLRTPKREAINNYKTLGTKQMKKI